MQKHLLFSRRRTAFSAVAAAAAFAFLAGCAKVPAGTVPTTRGRQLVVSLSVDREINPNYYYFVLINLTDDQNDAGPVPVVQGPLPQGPPSGTWGNGFAAPAPFGNNPQQGFVGFVRYGPGGYGVYRVGVNTATNTLLSPVLNVFDFLNRPDVILNDPTSGGRANTMAFQLDLSRLPNYVRPGADGVLGTADDTTARFVQINLLATDNVPAGSVDPFARKNWDALGDGRSGGLNDPVNVGNPGINTWLTIPLDQDITRTETETNLEPPDNDVRERLEGVAPDPDLDIRDWTIEIRSPR